MVRKLVLASGGALALVAPEMFEQFFERLRESPYFLLYQIVTLLWTALFLLTLVPWGRLKAWYRPEAAQPRKVEASVEERLLFLAESQKPLKTLVYD